MATYAYRDYILNRIENIKSETWHKKMGLLETYYFKSGKTLSFQ